MIRLSLPLRPLAALVLALLLTPAAASGTAVPQESCPDSLPVLVSRPFAGDAGLGAGDRLRLSASP
nr:hypothetical protein [Candidatus Palauibacterales bacterium]